MKQNNQVDLLKELNDGHWFNKELYYFDEISSTNDWINECGKSGFLEGTLVFAKTQKSGKGSHKRCWESPLGGLWYSFLLKPQVSESSIFGIAPLVAYSIAVMFEEKYNLEVKIKWPNDIILNEKKIAGILTEMYKNNKGELCITVGIGINVNISEFPELIKEKASSLYLETRQEYNVLVILSDLMKQFYIDYTRFCNENGMYSIIDDYNRYLIHYNKDIVIVKGRNKDFVKSLGIDYNGALNVLLEGAPMKIKYGEVSLRSAKAYI